MATCKDCFHWNACKKMLEAMWGHSVPSGYEGGADRCKDFISASDVVPRAEVAKEVFGDIVDMLLSNHIIGYTTENGEWVYHFKNSLIEEIATLEKKYTEGEK